MNTKELDQEIRKIKINTVNEVWKLYKDQEAQYFEQYNLGLITRLELGNQVIKLDKEHDETMKNLFK